MAHDADDLNNWYVRASNGKMVPFASFADTVGLWLTAS
jgi:multidrug efflux pump subunit AcrB